MHRITLKLRQFLDLLRPMTIEELKALSPSYIGGPPEVIPEIVIFPETPVVLLRDRRRIGATKAKATNLN